VPPLICAGIAVLTALLLNTGMSGVRGLFDSLAACLIAGAAFSVMFFLGGMGGGDVKLMAAIAAFAGLGRLLPLLLSTALAGGLFALVMAAAHGTWGAILRSGLRWVWPRPMAANVYSNLTRPQLYLPYGVPIAVGALFTFYSGVLAS
jgi:prepilin peptidase CpaA